MRVIFSKTDFDQATHLFRRVSIPRPACRPSPLRLLGQQKDIVEAEPSDRHSHIPLEPVPVLANSSLDPGRRVWTIVEFGAGRRDLCTLGSYFRGPVS